MLSSTQEICHKVGDLDKRALDYFNTHLPYKPYCTDDLHVGLRILPQAQALLKRYIQPNPLTQCLFLPSIWIIKGGNRLG